MKKFIAILLLFTTFAISAQDVYWTNYSFIVEPENEATVVKLIDDYFKEHKTEGVTVNLYANHFHDDNNTSTHTISFSGSLDALGGMYAADGGDAWDLLGARLDHHIKDGSGARMGTVKATFGDTEGNYPIRQYYILDSKDPAAMEKALTKFNTDFKPEGRLVMMGDINSGISPEGENHWALVCFKDFKSAMGGANAGLTDKEKAAREAGWKTFMETNGGVRMVYSGLWVLVGTW